MGSPTELDFALSHTFGGQFLVRGVRDRRRPVFRLRHGQRRAPVRRPRARAPGRAGRRRSTSSCPTCTGTTSWAFPSSGRPTSRATRLRIYGCHDDARARPAPAAGAALLPGAVLAACGEYRIRAARARRDARGEPASGSRRQPQFHSGDSFGFRFEHDGRSFVYTHRFRAQARRTAARRSASSPSSATPTW